MSGDFENATTGALYQLLENTTFSENFAKLLQYEADQRDLETVFSQDEAIILSVFIGLLSVFGILANVTTFVVILKTPKLNKSVFNTFLMSLCVSDFMSSVISPFVLYRSTWGFHEWSLPAVFCKLAISIDFWTSCSTIQHVLIFALLRLFSIKFPHKFGGIKPLHAKITVSILWIESFAASFIVYFLWPGVFPPGSRTPSGDISKACTAQRQWIAVLMRYVQIGFPTVLYAPMAAVIVVTAILTILILRRKRERQNKGGNQSSGKVAKKENFALIQLSLIMASFLLGYLPDMAYRMTAVILRNQNRSLPARVEWQFSVTAHALLRISECLNPMFYNFGSSNMRGATKEFLRPILVCARGSETLEKSKSRSTGAS